MPHGNSADEKKKLSLHYNAEKIFCHTHRQKKILTLNFVFRKGTFAQVPRTSKVPYVQHWIFWEI